MRDAVINTFEKFKDGELRPVTSDAVVQSHAWDRMAESITDLVTTVKDVAATVNNLAAMVGHGNSEIVQLWDSTNRRCCLFEARRELRGELATTSPLCDTLPDRENAAVSEDERLDIESVRLWCRSAHVSDPDALVAFNERIIGPWVAIAIRHQQR